MDENGAHTSAVWKYDGASGTRKTAAAAFGGRKAHAMAVVGSTLYVIGGTNAQGDLGDVWRSTDDGATWTRASASAFKPRSRPCALEFGGEQVVIGGIVKDERLGHDVVRASQDGSAWSPQPVPPASPLRTVSSWMQQCGVMNGRVYFVSNPFTTSSTDLIHWRYEPPFLQSYPAPGLAAQDGRLFVVTGDGTSTCSVLESIPLP